MPPHRQRDDEDAERSEHLPSLEEEPRQREEHEQGAERVGDRDRVEPALRLAPRSRLVHLRPRRPRRGELGKSAAS
jgi:hypothetical protein